MPTSFGKIISPADVEKWVIDFSKKWFQEYLHEIERQRGLGVNFYSPLKDVITANDFNHWPEDQLPCLVIMNTGLGEAPAKRGGHWDATWVIGAAIVVSTPTRSATRQAMNDYGAAFTAMVLQTRSLERPEVRGVTWIDSRPAPIPDEMERTMGAQQMFFNVEVEAVIDAGGAPPAEDPRPDPSVPPPDPSTVTIVGGSVTINQQED